MTFASTQKGPAFRPAAGGLAWLVRTESIERVRVAQVMESTESATVLPVQQGSFPATALWEDLHATESVALDHLEHRATSIREYVKSRRAGKEAA